MATKKKENKQVKTRRILVMDFGRFEIVGEDGRYFYCENTQFFKNNKHILEIAEEPIENDLEENSSTNAEKKKEESDE